MVVLSSLLLASLALEVARSAAFNQLPRNPGSSHIALTQRKPSLLQHLARGGRETTQTIKNNSVKPPTISCHQILIVHWGFWFGDFSIGGASSLNLRIDTKSGDVILNPGFYVPSTISENLTLPL
jgi:hypothetical protein